MKRIVVTSSNIRSIGYEASSYTLEIEFKDLTTYRYHNVPEAVHSLLMASESHGKYFNQHIRDRYLTTKLG